VQSEPDRHDDDEIYELDRKAWNLPRPRAQLAIESAPKASPDDRSGSRSHARREDDRTT
jgi:hypothetical protein